MGRHQLPKNQVCTKCNDDNNICRFRVKPIRGKKSARYIQMIYAIHRDGTEHAIKIKDELANAVSIMTHVMSRVRRKMKEFPLTEDETRRVNMGLCCFMINFLEPQRSIAHLRR